MNESQRLARLEDNLTILAHEVKSIATRFESLLKIITNHHPGTTRITNRITIMEEDLIPLPQEYVDRPADQLQELHREYTRKVERKRLRIPVPYQQSPLPVPFTTNDYRFTRIRDERRREEALAIYPAAAWTERILNEVTRVAHTPGLNAEQLSGFLLEMQVKIGGIYEMLLRRLRRL